MKSTGKMRAILGAERAAVGALDRTLMFAISAVRLLVREQFVTDKRKKRNKRKRRTSGRMRSEVQRRSN